ncbi:hypothetical protein [Erwinia pyrifoliae]|uniref:Uncharacterized protein n=1 Tax=Erwinia pyrifoliae TaxID=79967 RepID=A0ABY5X7V0_ERWPY|nr:hypothetical protein [Erwinia pyrifoliae]UWS33463.1 hypothetical protein NYP84_18150 [Erwinia pyrifoliae]
MSDFFKKWLRSQLRYFASTLIPVLLIIGFGMLAVTFWPSFAWSSTAVFVAVVIAITFWVI